MTPLILAIDQGTTSTRAIAFELREDRGLHPVAVSQIELEQHFPRSGWVEHDAAEIWSATLQTCREVIRKVEFNKDRKFKIEIDLGDEEGGEKPKPEDMV